MSLGLLLGAATVDYRTSLADLALMGALTGLVLGVAQAVALPRRTHRRWIWAAALPLLWALGWTATTLGGIAVDQQYSMLRTTALLTGALRARGCREARPGTLVSRSVCAAGVRARNSHRICSSSHGLQAVHRL
jgi:hypothetical protein